jgi:hypothetical protein
MATAPLPIPTNPEPIDQVPFQGEHDGPLPQT